MASSETVNQLVAITVASAQARELLERLISDGFFATQIDSIGGFLHEATISLLVGLDRTRLSRFLELVHECCQKRRQFIPSHAEALFLEAPTVMTEVEIGGATLFVFDVERFEQI